MLQQFWFHGLVPTLLAALLNRAVSGPALTPSAIDAAMPTNNAAATVTGMAIDGAAAAGVPSSTRLELLASAGKPMASSSDAAASTQARCASASEWAMANSLA